jgi:hypothetical protein
MFPLFLISVSLSCFLIEYLSILFIPFWEYLSLYCLYCFLGRIYMVLLVVVLDIKIYVHTLLQPISVNEWMHSYNIEWRAETLFLLRSHHLFYFLKYFSFKYFLYRH